jgi:uncharacterized membrane protein YciS (DUF1049 family)
VLVFLFVLVLLVLAGLLGVVLKAVALLVLVGVLTALTLAAIAYLAIRHQMRKLDRELDRRATQIEVGRPKPNESLPRSDVDDRY